MPFADRLLFAGRLTAALGRVAGDAAADRFGAALPLSPHPFTTPARFASLVGDARCPGWSTDEVPVSIGLTPQHAPSSNCRNSVLALDWAGREAREARPRSVFLKQPSADLATRVFANVIGFWKIECAFARHLAQVMPIDSPAIYAVSQRRSRFFIAMENLLERDDTTLYTNRDFVAGIDVERARRCVRTLAQLHAGFEGWAPARREAALPMALHPFLSPRLVPVMRAVHRLSIPRCQARSGGVFDDACVRTCRDAIEHWPVLQRFWYREPLTLVHGDSHLGNFFESKGQLGMLDFQGAHWGRGPRDVHYCLVNSMEPELLARHEAELVAEYVAERARCGAPLDAEIAWEEYRAFSIQTLITAVVSLGLGSFTDSDDAVRAMLERSVASLRRLDFAGWLGERVEGRVEAGHERSA